MANPARSGFPSRSRNAGGGFTLVEAIAVMVLAGILAGVAIPTMGSIAGSRSGAAQRQIQRELSYARERAMTTGSRVWVVFNVGGGTYSILGEPAGNPGRINALTMTDPATGRPHVTAIGDLFPGVSLVSATFDSGPEIGFDWQGRPLAQSGAALSTAGAVTITGNRSIAVQPRSGLVTVP